MAKIHNYHIDQMSESFSVSTNVTSYPVEKGYPISDSVTRNPDTFSISGNILETKKRKNSNAKRKHLKQLAIDGKPIKYVGRMNCKDVVITNFDGSYSKEIANGFQFSLSLQRVRIAKTPYRKKKTKKKTSGKKSTTTSNKNSKKKKYHIVKRNENYTVIARKYGTTVSALMKLNKWKPRAIPIGARMRIK